MTRRPAIFYALALLAAVGLALAPFLVFQVAPVHPTMGFIQKIFYFHVPCAWAMFLGAIVAAIGGAAFLFAGRRWGDELVISGAEIATTFGILVLVTGPLWAKKSWGHYWVWDVRLTTVLILFLSLLGVLLARRYAGPAARRVAAGIALFAAINVPLVYLSVKLWPRTVHPQTTVVTTLPPAMKSAFFVSLAAFSVLFVLLLVLRMNLERSRNELDDVLARSDQWRER